MTTLVFRARPTGMLGFTMVWFGQLVSLTGSAMSQLALAYWAWEVTGSATALSLTIFFGFGPGVLLSPLADALVDRSNRKLMMMLSDLGAGLSTLVILGPAYSAAISTMLAAKDYARANGLLELAQAG